MKELKEHGLDVPQATELAFELKRSRNAFDRGDLKQTGAGRTAYSVAFR